MPNRAIKPIEMFGPPGGIDQSKNPRKNSIYDGVNLDTSKGYWSTRPGLYRLKEYLIPLLSENVIAGLFEFKPDKRFDTCHYNALVYPVVRTTTAHAGPKTAVYEMRNLVDAPILVGSSATWGWDYAVNKTAQERFTAVQGLLRYEEGEYSEDTPRYTYTPCLIMTNGTDPVLVYHQKNGEGVCEQMESMDGGTDLTFLSEATRGKWVASFRGRFFIANVPGSGNRVHFSTNDTAKNFPVNCWADNHWYDIGSGDDEITGIIGFRDTLVIFKENSIWTAGGIGSGGLWDIRQVDSSHGAISQHCILDLGDRLVFMSKSGAYEWNGGMARSISHPQLQDLWTRLDWSTADHKVPSAVYDEQNQRLMFGVGKSSEVIDSWLVYDLKLRAWSRWGAWYDENYSRYPGGDIGTYRTPDVAVATRMFGSKPQVLFSLGLALYSYTGSYDYEYANQRSINWFLRTQRYFAEDPQVKLLRHFKIAAKMTGDWELKILPMVNGESLEGAFRRRSPKKWNICITSGLHQEITVDGTSCFQTVDDGPVDLIEFPEFWKRHTGVVLETATAPNKVKFNAAKTVDDGETMVLPQDKNPLRTIEMYEFASRLYNTGKWGDASCEKLDFKEVTVGFREMGKDFCVFMTNIGQIAGSNHAVPGSKLEISGWGFWVLPKGRLRPISGRTTVVGRPGDPAKDYTP